MLVDDVDFLKTVIITCRMKKFLTVLFLIFMFAIPAKAESEYAKLYKFSKVPDFELVNGLDPYQNEDYFKYAYAPYPLFRLCTDLYFKNQHIPAGYYVLTPRTINGRDYVFFKENGKVSFVIPVVKKEIVAPDFYSSNLPTPQYTKWQSFTQNVSKGFHKLFKNSSKKAPAPQSFIKTEFLDDNMFLIMLYYGTDKYHMVMKSAQY